MNKINPRPSRSSRLSRAAILRECSLIVPHVRTIQFFACHNSFFRNLRGKKVVIGQATFMPASVSSLSERGWARGHMSRGGRLLQHLDGTDAR